MAAPPTPDSPLPTHRDRFLGTWDLVPELSLYETGTPPAAGRYTIAERAPGELALRIEWRMERDGPLRETGFGGPSDGTPQPLPRVEGAPPGTPDALTLTRIDGRTLDSAALRDGVVVAWARRVASEDGALLSVVQETVAPDGRRTRNFQVYRRVTARESSAPKLYDELAEWWPLLSAPADYEEEAAFYARALVGACERTPRTMLELGSGGGNNASFLKRRFAMTLVDPAPGMLAVSRRLNPECEHVEGDMRTVRLGRTFDCVFVHDAVVYMTTEADLRRAVETAWLHCEPGGAALFAPDHVREKFRPSTDHGGHDGRDGRSLRYLEWTWDPDPSDSTYVVDYAYILREPDGSARVEHDRHAEGLFPREVWLRVLREAGFVPEVVPFDHSELEPETYEVFVARRPAL